MAKSKGKRGGLDLSPLIEEVGLEKYLEVVPVGDFINTVGPKKIIKELGVDRYLANLSVQDLRKLKDRLK